MVLNCEAKNIKLEDEKYRKNICDIPQILPKILGCKENHKIKGTKKNKRQTTEQKNIFVIHMSDKGLKEVLRQLYLKLTKDLKKLCEWILST